jgi:hypothetical protein
VKVIFFEDHVSIFGTVGTVARVPINDAKKLALQLNNYFALREKYDREVEGEDAGPRKA